MDNRLLLYFIVLLVWTGAQETRAAGAGSRVSLSPEADQWLRQAQEETEAITDANAGTRRLVEVALVQARTGRTTQARKNIAAARATFSVFSLPDLPAQALRLRLVKMLGVNGPIHSGDATSLAYDLASIGKVEAILGDRKAAGRTFKVARNLLALSGDEFERSRTTASVAGFAAEGGMLEVAQSLCRSMDYSKYKLDAVMTTARALIRAGKMAEARALLKSTEASIDAGERGDFYERCGRQAGKLFVEMGAPQEAFAFAERCHGTESMDILAVMADRFMTQRKADLAAVAVRKIRTSSRREEVMRQLVARMVTGQGADATARWIVHIPQLDIPTKVEGLLEIYREEREKKNAAAAAAAWQLAEGLRAHAADVPERARAFRAMLEQKIQVLLTEGDIAAAKSEIAAIAPSDLCDRLFVSVLEAEAKAGLIGAAAETARLIADATTRARGLRRAAEIWISQERKEAALDVLHEASILFLQHEKPDPDDLDITAKLLIDGGDAAGALDLIEHALPAVLSMDQGPRDGRLKFISDLLARLGKMDRAWEIASAISNELYRAYAQREVVASEAQSGAFAPAKARAQRIERKDARALAQEAIALAQWARGDRPGARATMDSIETSQGRLSALGSLAKALARRGDVPGALELASSVTAAGGYRDSTYEDIAKACFDRGDVATAFDVAQRVKRSDSTLRQMVRTLTKGKPFTEAWPWVQKLNDPAARCEMCLEILRDSTPALNEREED